MADAKYKLRYLPLFYEDLEQKVIYIAEELHNQQAANELFDAVENAINQAIEENPKAVTDYKNGKENSVNFLVGQVMRLTKGKANAGETNKIIRDKLDQM